MEPANGIDIEIVYASPQEQQAVSVRVALGTRAIDAIHQSGILRGIPARDVGKVKLGIFGRRVPHDSPLRAGDRIEIYRALLADPKSVRRSRAQRTSATARRAGVKSAAAE